MKTPTNRYRVIMLVLFLCILPLSAVRAQDALPIAYGDLVEGRVPNDTDPVVYVFDGRAGDSIVIETVSDTVDTYLVLADTDGNTLVENDDISSSDLNARIEFTLEADGQYLIGVFAYSAGDYILSLELISERPAQGESQGGATASGDITGISYGETVSGSALDIETPVLFVFSGRAGDVVRISATSERVDLYLVLADIDGNTLAENDDISADNLNSAIEFVLPVNGDYLIGVFGYTSGPFDLALEVLTDGAPTTITVDEGIGGEIITGEISDDEPLVYIPITVENDGDTVTVDARTTDGDLDLYLGLLLDDTVVAENDDRSQDDLNPLLEYPLADAGEYTLVVTRYGFDEGETSGSFELSYKVSSGGSVLAGGGTPVSSPPDLAASGYPTIVPQQTAEWTVLVYMGGDNNLEDGLINDLDEFEIAGGSTDDVRIIALLDRSGEYDSSNDNWDETRIYEVGRDTSGDVRFTYPPTIDTRAIVSLGELDTSYSDNLRNFLVWGISNYPAQRYAISLNDHGGAWTGIVTDDTTGYGILTMPELQTAFESALAVTGVDKFDLLVNDACLMSSVEYYAALAPYFDFVISSPEITFNPGFDMTLLTETLNGDPAIDLGRLGALMIDKYMADMNEMVPDMVPVLGAAVTDLRGIDGLVGAVNAFAEHVSANPQAYASLLGEVRANVYIYSFFLPEEEYGPPTIIDLGDFMHGIIDGTDDRELAGLAQNVLDAMDAVRLYADAGPQLGRATSYYNIYFPARSSDFSPDYIEQTPLQSWALMLRSYYGGVGPGFRGARAGVAGPAAAPVEAPSTAPQVTITNLFSQETSVEIPAIISMEVAGRNIARGIFTVDQIQPDGTAVRLDQSLIVTEVIEDGVVDYINLWNPGVDDFDFTWKVYLPVVTDGNIVSNELVVNVDDVASIAGRYHYPHSDTWIEVTVLFDDDGRTSAVLGRRPGSTALANVRLEAGGEFQSYRSIVTPDGRVLTEPGTTFTWPEDGISWYSAPAPSGDYNLGFLVEAAGGVTGFNSVVVTVNNDDIDPDLQGYVDDDWGFILQFPADWFDFTYFPDNNWLQASSADYSELIFVYPVEAVTDPQVIGQTLMDSFTVDFDGQFEPITVAGMDAAAFTFTYLNSEGVEFTGRAFAVWIDYLELGLVFSAEASDPARAEELFNLLVTDIEFFNASELKDRDTGAWSSDIFTDETHYPVPRGWMPGFDTGLWWVYTPDNDPASPTAAYVTVLTNEANDASAELDTLIDQELSTLSGFEAGERSTYYGQNHTWEALDYTYEGDDGIIAGRLYLTVVDGVPYALRFEAPQDEFVSTFNALFTVMLDGFRISTD